MGLKENIYAIAFAVGLIGASALMIKSCHYLAELEICSRLKPICYEIDANKDDTITLEELKEYYEETNPVRLLGYIPKYLNSSNSRLFIDLAEKYKEGKARSQEISDYIVNFYIDFNSFRTRTRTRYAYYTANNSHLIKLLDFVEGNRDGVWSVQESVEYVYGDSAPYEGIKSQTPNKGWRLPSFPSNKIYVDKKKEK
ncbi:MAG: hypothetical protein KKF46_06020 [Nanoarchaeota archaeon]|nr:hypothetical protein [Nanoarchaeota archaeon]MBU1321890.1 hypothetical protein [Nanoarchaeota archaeon]MBU1597665.1 hypothetical protein [Nanoarchaeota archaeon]MBU2442228.1 hypothetical protein [Nanoarchaeota archaeon]